MLRNEGLDENGMPRFTDVGMALGVDEIKDGRGTLHVDLDNDGDLDIVVNNNPGDQGSVSMSPTVLRNERGNHRNWLAIDLQGVQSNRDALGTSVVVEVDNPVAGEEHLKTQVREVSCGSSYASQVSSRLYFGLGSQTTISKLTVRWPSGKTQEFSKIEANQFLKIREGDEIVVQKFNGQGAKLSSR